MATLKAAMEAREKVSRIVGDLPGISGVGVTWDDKGQPCVRVNVDHNIAAAERRRIPRSVDAVPVVIETVGLAELE